MPCPKAAQSILLFALEGGLASVHMQTHYRILPHPAEADDNHCAASAFRTCRNRPPTHWMRPRGPRYWYSWEGLLLQGWTATQGCEWSPTAPLSAVSTPPLATWTSPSRVTLADSASQPLATIVVNGKFEFTGAGGNIAELMDFLIPCQPSLSLANVTCAHARSA